LGAVSMAAVAAKLGFTPMSLYRYVSAKDDLLLLMEEQAIGLPPEEIREHDGWRARLRAYFEAQVLIYLRHPWILSLPITGSPITPNSSAWLDGALDALGETPLRATERLAVALAVTGQARWYGTVLAGYTEQARTSGMSPEEITVREAALFDRVVTAAEFPALRAAIDAGVFLAEGDPFRFSIERYLEGVEVYIAGLDRGDAHADAAAWLRDDSAAIAGDKRVRAAAKSVREAEKVLRAARKEERQARRDAAAREAARTEK